MRLVVVVVRAADSIVVVVEEVIVSSIEFVVSFFFMNACMVVCLMVGDCFRVGRCGELTSFVWVDFPEAAATLALRCGTEAKKDMRRDGVVGCESTHVCVCVCLPVVCVLSYVFFPWFFVIRFGLELELEWNLTTLLSPIRTKGINQFKGNERDETEET